MRGVLVVVGMGGGIVCRRTQILPPPELELQNLITFIYS